MDSAPQFLCSRGHRIELLQLGSSSFYKTVAKRHKRSIIPTRYIEILMIILHSMLLPRIQINIVVPIDTPQIWTWRRTHENDFIFEKSGEGEEWVNYPATEIRDAVLLVKTPEDLCRFLGKYGDPGINPSEYVGTRNYAVGNAKTRTFKEYAPPRTHRVFLGEFVELQAQLKRAMDDKVESWNFGGTVDLESMLETMVCELKFSHEELTGICTINNPVEVTGPIVCTKWSVSVTPC